MHRARLKHGRGSLDEAMADYDRAVERAEQAAEGQDGPDEDPTLALLYCNRGDALHDLFREEEAEASFAEARRRHPVAAAGLQGNLWMRRGYYERALDAFDELVSLVPNDAQAYLQRGVAHQSRGNLEQASDDFSEAIRCQPEGTVGYAMRARVRHEQGRPDEAMTDLAQHLHFHPDDPEAHLFRAAIHKEQKSWPAAFEDLTAAHRAAPDHPMVCNNLAWMLATCPDPQFRDGARAAALARQACEATEWKHPFCMGTLGAALAETGAFDEAVHWQTEALSLYPVDEIPAGRARLELYQAGQPYRD
jgi:serine/threonine-protein kinase